MTYRRSLFLFGSALAIVSPSFGQADGLNLRFANGIAAIAEEKVITVDDIRREISPLIPQIQRDARNEKEFNEKLESLQDSVIQDLIDKVLIIKEFRKAKDEKEVRHIPASYIDNRIAETLSEQFDNDRSKFLAYLRAKGVTPRDYRKEVEEDIIYHYMQQQQKKSQSVVSPVRIETFYRENKDRFYQEDSVHLRLIQLSRADNATDAELKIKADEILTKFRAGSKFEDLAQEYSQDSRRAKGGDWGWVKRSDLKDDFKNPLFVLKPGEITAPLMLTEGCFLLFAEERKYAGNQAIDEVRDQIERMLITQMARTGQERWLERLRRNGYVKHY
ncbi:MAG: peptidylprolyl isomerase [Undibacterium sp.]|nr:peptidylprolyl isomerase [Opitutaceae bacterium]